MGFTLGSAPAAVSESAGQINVSASWTSGNSLVGLLYWAPPSGQTLSSVQYDPGGGNQTSLTEIGTFVNGGDATDRLQMFYLGTVPATGTVAVRATFSATISGQGIMVVYELIGGDTSNLLDSQNSATGNSSTASTTVTTITDNCAIFAVCATNGSDPTVSGSYTIITMSNVYFADSGEYLLDVGAAGSNSVSMNVGSGIWGIKAAAFKSTVVVPYISSNLGRLTELEWRPAPFRPGIAR